MNREAHVPGIHPDRNTVSWAYLLLVCFSASMVYLLLPDALGFKLIAFIALWCGAAAVVRVEISHPYIWFGFFYMLYSISGPVLHFYDIHPYGVWGGRDVRMLDFSGVLDLEFACFLTFLIIVGPVVRDLRPIARSRDNRYVDGAQAIAWIAGALVLVVLAEISMSGFSSKGDVTVYGSWLTRLSFAYSILALAACIVMFGLFAKDKPREAFLVLGAMLVFGYIVIYISGQRNFLFRFALLAVFVVHFTHRRITWPIALALTIGGIAMISVLAAEKMALTSDAGQSASVLEGLPGVIVSYMTKHPEAFFNPTGENYWHIFLLLTLGDELMTASNNLALIMDRIPIDMPYMNGSPLFSTDIARILLPGFLLPGEPATTAAIYQATFFTKSVEQGLGPGFSLLGHGYMHFGSLGAVGIIAFYSTVIRLLYRAAESKLLWFLCFCAFIPIAVYSTRMDLVAAASQGIKHVFLPILAMSVVSYMRRGSGVAGPPAGARPTGLTEIKPAGEKLAAAARGKGPK